MLFSVDADDKLIPQGLITFWDMKNTLAKYTDFQVYSWDCPQSYGVTVPIKHVYSSQRQAFASMDDEEVISKKVQWAKVRGLGGVCFWDGQQDRYGDLLEAMRAGWGA